MKRVRAARRYGCKCSNKGQMCKQDCCWIADSGKQFPHAGDMVVRYCTAGRSCLLCSWSAELDMGRFRHGTTHCTPFALNNSKTCPKARSYFQNFRLLGVLN